MIYLVILDFTTQNVDILEVIETEDFDLEEFLTNDLDEYLTNKGYDTSNIQWMHCDKKPIVNFKS